MGGMSAENEAKLLRNHLCRAGLDCTIVQSMDCGFGLGAVVYFADIDQKHAVRFKLRSPRGEYVPLTDQRMKDVELTFREWHEAKQGEK